jgi:hypothetical protein
MFGLALLQFCRKGVQILLGSSVESTPIYRTLAFCAKLFLKSFLQLLQALRRVGASD